MSSYLKAPTAQTELEAVNTILATIGEIPVATLHGQLPSDVAMAVATLNEALRELQMEGWHFNTEDDYPLPLNEDDEIFLPPNCIRLSFQDPDSKDVLVRGQRLYDRANHTFKFTESISGSITFMLPFEEAPETFKWYATVKAARRFQTRAVGSETLDSFSAQDELYARTTARREDAELARNALPKGTGTSFMNGWNVADTLKR